MDCGLSNSDATLPTNLLARYLLVNVFKYLKNLPRPIRNAIVQNDVRDLKFNTTGECKAPLTKAIDEASFYEGVEGCGIQCHDPLFTDEERQNIRTTIKWGFSLSCICNGFAVVRLNFSYHHN